eukprot:780665-Rhodomonas_salina.2
MCAARDIFSLRSQSITAGAVKPLVVGMACESWCTISYFPLLLFCRDALPLSFSLARALADGATGRAGPGGPSAQTSHHIGAHILLANELSLEHSKSRTLPTVKMRLWTRRRSRGGEETGENGRWDTGRGGGRNP